MKALYSKKLLKLSKNSDSRLPVLFTITLYFNQKLSFGGPYALWVWLFCIQVLTEIRKNKLKWRPGKAMRERGEEIYKGK